MVAIGPWHGKMEEPSGNLLQKKKLYARSLAVINLRETGSTATDTMDSKTPCSLQIQADTGNGLWTMTMWNNGVMPPKAVGSHVLFLMIHLSLSVSLQRKAADLCSSEHPEAQRASIRGECRSTRVMSRYMPPQKSTDRLNQT